METAIVTGSFDDLRSTDVRFLEEAARWGELHLFLWSDQVVRTLEGHLPRFPMEERMYLLKAIRYVRFVHPVEKLSDPDRLPAQIVPVSGIWVVRGADGNPQKQTYCDSVGIKLQVVKEALLNQFPYGENRDPEDNPDRKKVVVTGCFDWFHSGHVRFFEEVSALGDLYVVAGSDRNVELLKGEGHPLFSQDERRYIVQSVRYVKQALISSGSGWMDAEPEIERIKPDIYAVNEDGDVPEKRAFCDERGIQYVVLKRTPKEGLPRRVSTDLRGF
jgi:cytidyltransferase-like protein